MLFVSRYVGSDLYGICDTDDMTEEVINSLEILNACNALGKGVIRGVDLYNGLGVEGSYIIDTIRPYQPPETKTQLQVKTKMLKDIDITVFGDIITLITIPDDCKQPYEIRLSDFGHILGDYIFTGNLDTPAKHIVTMVLDDSLSFGEDTFRVPLELGFIGLLGMGVVFDVTEVTKEDLLEAIYCLISCEEHGQLASIIDNPDRKYRMRAKYALC